jgi:translation initiation factor 3 subunit E
MENLENKTSAIREMVDKPEVRKMLEGKVDFQYLTTTYGYRPEMLDDLHKHAIFHFQIGNYSICSQYLYNIMALSSHNSEISLSALWGDVASKIILCCNDGEDGNWEVALELLKKLKDAIDQKDEQYGSLQGKDHHLVQLQQRKWFIHWSLFVFFKHPKGRETLLDIFFQPQYINTIQTDCPWILRYLTAAVITNKKRANKTLKELVKLITQESHAYSDPLTQFIKCLHVEFDFDAAQDKLAQVEELLLNDFFLSKVKDEILEGARLFIFETYCRIHQSIDVAGLCKKLNMDQAEGEKWIGNVIRNGRMDAKIDSSTNTIIMGTYIQSIYQQVVQKTDSLKYRTATLVANVEKKEIELSRRRSTTA